VTHDRLEELVLAHQNEIYRYVRYLGADPATAADLVQDAFLAAFQSADTPELSDVRARTAWLREIARLRFLMFCRRRRSSPVAVSSEWLEQAEATWSSDFLREGDGFDALEALEGCLGDLPRRDRELLDLRYREKKPRSEMADRHRMSEDGMKSLLRRIRSTLETCIRAKLGWGEA
jgi:RNA polymerase sigma-70 factor, ECF subfamily